LQGARTANKQDIPALLGLCKRFFSVSGYAENMTFHEKSMRRTLEALVQNHIVMVHGSPPVGVLAAVVGPMFFNAKELSVAELFWWVDPEHRGVGTELLSALEAEAQKRGAKRVSMLCLEKLEPEKIGQMYQRRGYSLVEHNYMKEL
jgi:GNAT superfamily N-acetyltransferase